MTIMTLVLTGILIYILLRQDTIKQKYINIFVLSSVIEISDFQGYFLKMGTTSINFKFFTMIVLLLISLIYIYKVGNIIEKKLFFLSMLLLGLLFINILIEIVFPYSGMIINYSEPGGWDAYVMGLLDKSPLDMSYGLVFLLYVKLFTCILTVWILKLTFLPSEILQTVIRIVSYLRWWIYYGFFEFFLKNILQVPDFAYGLSENLVGSNSQGISRALEKRGDWYVVQGLSFEPSHFVICLFITVVLLILIQHIMVTTQSIQLYQHARRRNIEIFLAALLMFLTGGFSAFLYFFMIILIWIIIKFDFNQKNLATKLKTIGLIGMVFVAVVMGLLNFLDVDSYLGWRMLNFSNTVDVITSGDLRYINLSAIVVDSTFPRLISVYDVLSDAFSRPLLGLGIGMQPAHSGVAMQFSDFGIIGVILWSYILLYRKKNTVQYDMMFFLAFFFLANLFAGTNAIIYESHNIIILEMTAIYSTCYFKKDKLSSNGG